MSSTPVSYTHLDVYKRQGYGAKEIFEWCRERMVQPIFFSKNLYKRYASLINIEKVNGRHVFPDEDGEICLGG